jgi:hypothetical protein
MYNELKAVKNAVIDLSFVTTTRKQDAALLKLKKRVTDLEERLAGKEHYESMGDLKDGM